MNGTPELFVTNFNRNYTGVSATAAAVAREQARSLRLALVGQPLPGLPAPITRAEATRLSRTRPPERPFAIWHVRRNPEMQAALWARDILRLPVRIVFTSSAQRLHSAWPRFLISRMDAVIATSEEAAAFVPHVRAVVPHGVDLTRYFPADDRHAAWEAGGFGGARGVATIGRIRPEKGTDRFVEAMLRVLPRHPDVTALVIGRAAREHRGFLGDLRARIAEAGLAHRLLFPGEIGPREMPALIRGLSAVVMLPRYEGYGMVPLEAMASAVPFVATDTGAYRAFSGGGAAGTVVGLDDTGAAAEALDALLADPARIEAMGRAGRARAAAEYSAAAEARAITAVCERMWDEGA